jgi:hypothetical protein
LLITIVRLVVVAAVLLLLARAARMAWQQRRLAVAVWRRIRPHHVLGALGLLVVVLGTALTLLVAVPVTAVGLGSLVGLHGNAIFAPLEEVALRSGGAAAADAPHPIVMLGTVGFLGGLVLLFPWLAYVEERAFRAGTEDAGPGREAWVALKFGLLHMVMLIPLAAALAIAVAGFAYGRVYRRAFRRAAARTFTVEDAGGVPVVLHPPVRQARAEAVLESTVWHTTFNSLIVVLVLAGFVLDWVVRA